MENTEMFLFPPRPEKAIVPGLIKSFQARGFCAQRKKNGTLQVISIDSNQNVIYRTRHNEENKAWTPLPEMASYFAGFPDSVLCGELLHSKHPSVKNTIILFDVLRWLGRDLTGITLAERLEILRWINPLTKSIQVIETNYQDLFGLYNSLSDPLDEGLVLKNPKAVLRSCMRDGLNASWQVKVRKGTRNFGF
jgi:hypothetical protein